MVRPRQTTLALGFVLIVINKVSGFVLPTSTRYLLDNVIYKHQGSLLLPLTMAVVGRTTRRRLRRRYPIRRLPR